jgi:hypothetical protein
MNDNKDIHWSEETIIEDEETRIICIINKKNVEPPHYSIRIARRIGPANNDKISSFLPIFMRGGKAISVIEAVQRLIDKAEFYIETKTIERKKMM